ncbi:MAG: hypothetical protein L6R39_003807 [Caloplaca ligustica]|nr:MAG: hypothetical protein L6R39_003807 [Caloplaca ligustica]
MGFADIVARARAGSTLRSPTPLSPTQDVSGNAQFDEKLPLNEKESAEDGRDASLNTNGIKHGNATASQNRDPHLLVRTVPTWVHVLEDDDEGPTQATTRLLPSSPPSAQVAEHHYNSPERGDRPKPPRGRLYDHERDWAPPIPSAHPSEQISRWRSFVNASAYPAIKDHAGEVVTPEWLAQNGPDYSKPWMAGVGEGDAENARGFTAKRKAWWKGLQRAMIRRPTIPLVLRSIVWIFSLLALAVAASIHRLTDRFSKQGNIASTEMAIIVDVIALVYLLYITYDEYSGKPLGLRSARAKMRLIFLDLFFIVFDSANLSLAFAAIHNAGVCDPKTGVGRICRRQKTLASVLLIALIAWLLTFSISVLRLVPPHSQRPNVLTAFQTGGTSDPKMTVIRMH